MPSKSLLAAASAAAAARAARPLGVDVGEVTRRLRPRARPRAGRHRARSSRRTPRDRSRAAGVAVLSGAAVLTGPTPRDVGGAASASAAALLATGAAPALPPIHGLDRGGSAHQRHRLGRRGAARPARRLGGGPIGCELGQAFARLGVRGHPRRRLRPGARPGGRRCRRPRRRRPAARRRAACAPAPTGTAVAGTPALRCTSTTAPSVPFDRLLVAVGRRPRTGGLGLRGRRRRPVRRRRPSPSTHAAHHQPADLGGRRRHRSPAVHPPRRRARQPRRRQRGPRPAPRASTRVVPRVTYTSPEVASVGVERRPRRAERGCTVRRVEHDHVDRAVADGATDGFTRLVLDRRRRVRRRDRRRPARRGDARRADPRRPEAADRRRPRRHHARLPDLRRRGRGTPRRTTSATGCARRRSPGRCCARRCAGCAACAVSAARGSRPPPAAAALTPTTRGPHRRDQLGRDRAAAATARAPTIVSVPSARPPRKDSDRPSSSGPAGPLGDARRTPGTPSR